MRNAPRNPETLDLNPMIEELAGLIRASMLAHASGPGAEIVVPAPIIARDLQAAGYPGHWIHAARVRAEVGIRPAACGFVWTMPRPAVAAPEPKQSAASWAKRP